MRDRGRFTKVQGQRLNESLDDRVGAHYAQEDLDSAILPTRPEQYADQDVTQPTDEDHDVSLRRQRRRMEDTEDET